MKGLLKRYKVSIDNQKEKSQVEKDFGLATHDGLFDEYLEMGVSLLN